MANARLMVGVVGSPERAELAEQIGAFVGHLARPEPIDGIAAGFLASVEQLVADLVDRGVPGDARPLPVDELHRIAKPPIAVDKAVTRRAAAGRPHPVEWRLHAKN